MIGVNATAGQALKLLQTSSLSHVSGLARDASGNAPTAYLGLPGTKVDAAITAIMNILLDAQGNANISIVAQDASAYVRTGDGDDTLSMDVHQVGYLRSGKGNDNISIRTSTPSEAARVHHAEGNRQFSTVGDVDSGDGNDAVAIDSHGHVDNIDTGNGDDTLTVRTSVEHNDPNFFGHAGAMRIQTGAGDDAIMIAAPNGLVSVIQAGAGNDTLEIAGRYVSGIYGDEGDDTLRLTADRWVSGVWGGDGNDTIEVTAPTIGMVNGGKGDDTIVLNNTVGTVSAVDFNVGDGHDDVQTNSALFIRRFSGVNTRFDMSKAAVERVGDNALKITFDDADDSITIHLTGDMAGKPIALDFYKSGVLVIRRDDNDAPALPKMTVAANPLVLTRNV